jgi:hypothetical protein
MKLRVSLIKPPDYATEGMPHVPVLRGQLADGLGANTDSCDRIALQRASDAWIIFTMSGILPNRCQDVNAFYPILDILPKRVT